MRINTIKLDTDTIKKYIAGTADMMSSSFKLLDIYIIIIVTINVIIINYYYYINLKINMKQRRTKRIMKTFNMFQFVMFWPTCVYSCI